MEVNWTATDKSMYIIENNINLIVLVMIKLNLQLKKRIYQLRNDLFNWQVAYLYMMSLQKFSMQIGGCKEDSWSAKTGTYPTIYSTSQNIICYRMHTCSFFIRSWHDQKWSKVIIQVLLGWLSTPSIPF